MTLLNVTDPSARVDPLSAVCPLGWLVDDTAAPVIAFPLESLAMIFRVPVSSVLIPTVNAVGWLTAPLYTVFPGHEAVTVQDPAEAGE